MSDVVQIGNILWTIQDLKDKLKEFSELYKQRPIKDNPFGMMSPHMFLAWFVLQFLKPKYVIESGIYKGSGTWFFEKAVPNAKIYSLDIKLDTREYVSDRVTYFEKDFTQVKWSGYDIIKEETLCFFDDHQDAFRRTQFAKNNGFKTLMFEDNYPLNRGNCHSLKQAFHNAKESNWLKTNLKTYCELPPVFTSKYHRRGRKSRDSKENEWTYPTPDPLYKNVEQDYLQVYFDELLNYTWMCFVELP